MNPRWTTRALAAAGALAALGVACNAILGNDPVALESSSLDAAPVADARVDGGGGGDAATCNADLASDPANCGACGHSCLGGACQGRQCQPFVVATGLAGPAHLATDGAGTLFVATNDGAVRSCPTKGCGASAAKVTELGLDGGNPILTGLAVAAGNVYFVGYYTGALYMCPTAGCARPTVITSGIPNPFHLAVDSTNVYFLSASVPYVGRCPLPSCASGAVRMGSDGLKAYYGTVAEGPYVYWYGGGPNQQFDHSILYRIPKTAVDGGPEALLQDRTIKFSGPTDTNLAVLGGDLYFAEDGPDSGTPAGTISRMSPPSGAPSVVVGNLPPTRGIAVDAEHVYFVSYSSGTVSRCARAGCTTPTVLASAQDTPTGPLLTSDAVYWTEYFGGTIKGVAK